MPSYAVLATEVSTDPLSLGYAGKTDAQIAALMNASNISVLSPIPMPQVLIWAAANGVLDAISTGQTQQTAINTVSAATIRSICQAAIHMLGAASALDITNPAINGSNGMLQVLTAIGFLTSAQLTALLALGTTQTTRAMSLSGWGVPVQTPDITYARSI